jgi:hypothetical protein
VLVAIGGVESAKRVVKTAREPYPGIPIIGRARELREATDLLRPASPRRLRMWWRRASSLVMRCSSASVS